MDLWITHTDGTGDEETEVHQLVGTLLIVEVARQKNHILWTGSVLLKDSVDVIGKPIYHKDLERCKVMTMVKAIQLLESDGRVLAETMTAMNPPKT